MYNAKRDGAPSGVSSPIPSMGALEGRMTVLEVVATTSLAMVLKSGDKHAAHRVLSIIRKAMRAKCNDIHLNASDSASAISYAQELLDATLEDIEFIVPKSLSDDFLVA